MTCIAIHVIFNVSRYMEVMEIAENSRADYFRKRRENQKTFSVVLDRKKLEQFETKLKEEQKNKTDWLNEKIDEELGQKK